MSPGKPHLVFLRRRESSEPTGPVEASAARGASGSSAARGASGSSAAPGASAAQIKCTILQEAFSKLAKAMSVEDVTSPVDLLRQAKIYIKVKRDEIDKLQTEADPSSYSFNHASRECYDMEKRLHQLEKANIKLRKKHRCLTKLSEEEKENTDTMSLRKHELIILRHRGFLSECLHVRARAPLVVTGEPNQVVAIDEPRLLVSSGSSDVQTNTTSHLNAIAELWEEIHPDVQFTNGLTVLDEAVKCIEKLKKEALLEIKVEPIRHRRNVSKQRVAQAANKCVEPLRERTQLIAEIADLERQFRRRTFLSFFD